MIFVNGTLRLVFTLERMKISNIAIEIFAEDKYTLILNKLQVNFCFNTFNSLREKGRRGGAVARILASHQCDPGSTPGLGSR